MKLYLPAPWPYKLFCLALFGVAFGILYTYPNYFPRVPPSLLPRFAFENQIPLLPWTFVIYVSDLPFGLFVVSQLSTSRAFHTLLRRALAALVISSVIFWIYPTGYIREDFVPSGFALVDWVHQAIYFLDAPTNCFPSLHISFTALALISLGTERPLPLLVAGFWAGLIFLSVLTTKQHYFVDILGGVAVCGLVIGLDRWITSVASVGVLVKKWDETPWWSLSLPFHSRSRK